MNLLCLAGAALGAFSVTLEWVTQMVVDPRRFPQGLTFHFDLMGLIGSGLAGEFLVFAAGLFLAGTLIAFITPMGGFLQLAGLVLFYGKVVPEIASDTTIGLGAMFGIVSTILVLYSLFNPVGVGIPQGRGGPSGNYLTTVHRADRFRVNSLCVIGAALAVVALFLPWASTTLVDTSDEQTYVYPATPIDYVSSETLYEGVGTDAFGVTFSVLFAGVVLSFILPFGGFVQCAGLALFYVNIQDYLVTRSLPAFFRTEIAYGFFIAIVAAGITVLSFFIDLDRRPTRKMFALDRMLTWTLPRDRAHED